MPRFSIIIPCHNAAAFVGAAVGSCLAQTVRELEVIVVDDGSTDGSMAAVRALADARVRILPQSNSGVGAARNAGLAVAQGEYVNFLDADDLLEPEKLARQGRVLDENPDIELVLCDGRVIDAAGAVLRDHLVAVRRLAGPAPLFEALFMAGLFPPHVPLVRRAAALRVGGFATERDRAGWADTGFWMRLALAGGRYHLLAEKLCRYRQHGSNMSGQTTAMEDSALAIYADLMRSHPAECARALRSLQRSLSDTEGALLGAREAWDQEHATVLRERAGEHEWFAGRLAAARRRGLRSWLAVVASESVRPGARRVFLWGAGSGGRRVLALLRGLGGQPAGFVDGDPGKHGSVVDGVPVLDPETLPGGGPVPYVVIASGHAAVIRERLLGLGWREWTDFAAVDFEDVAQIEAEEEASGSASSV